MEQKLLQDISNKIDKLIALTAIQGKDENQQIKILRSLNFTFTDISKLTGVPESTIKDKAKKISSLKRKTKK
jgi:phage portal protein BeeE